MSNGSNQQAWGLALLRAVVGVVFVVHGGQKLFLFGFHGVAAFMGQIGIPVPAAAAVVVTLVEFLGGLALLLGLFTRWAALLVAADMMVAILVVHLKAGFFNPKGYEYPLTLLGACLTLALTGPGASSVDGLLRKRK
jgi:putative oxidoreductase